MTAGTLHFFNQNEDSGAFMFPIAWSTAGQLGVSFMPFAITLMVSAACTFITPTGYQTNLMICPIDSKPLA